MFFHTKTLALLLRHKRKKAATPTPTLLALLTDYTSCIDVSTLSKIIYSNTEKENIVILENILMKKMRIIKKEGVCCCVWPHLPSAVKDLLIQNRTGMPRSLSMAPSDGILLCNLKPVVSIDRISFGAEPFFSKVLPTLAEDRLEPPGSGAVLSEADLLSSCRLSENSRQERPAGRMRRKAARLPTGQSCILNFPMAMPVAIDKPKKFAPLVIKSATFIYNKDRISFDTIRKRDDLINPVKLQFIKHWDQRRPPIYRVRGKLIKHSHSYLKLREGIAYNEDSSAEWEELQEETSVSDDSQEESISDTSSDSMLCADSSNSEEKTGPQPVIKKPIFTHETVPVTIYFPLSKYNSVSLEESHNVPDSLRERIGEEIKGGASVSRIAALYNIKEAALAAYIANLTSQIAT